jgi:hypothetical protein
VPGVSGHAPSAVEVVHHKVIKLTGTGLADVDRVLFGAQTITSRSADDWHGGWFEVLSDGAVDVHPPQNQPAGGHELVLANPGYRSPAVRVDVAHNPTRFLGCEPRIRPGKTLHVAVHRGNEPPATLSLLTLSGSALPVHLPGLIDLAHGGHPAQVLDPSFYLVPGALPHDPALRTATWLLPVPPGLPPVTLYFQALMVDPGNLARFPIVVSTLDRTGVY